MKILFFGLGSIGQRHAKILLDDYDHEIFAFRTEKGQYKQELSVEEIFSWDNVEKINPDIAFITNVTSLHIKTAIKCAKNGYKLFIEKPIDSTKEGLNELLKIVKYKKLPTYVAYNLRFHPVIKKIKEYFNKNKYLHMRVVCTSFLPDWRPEQDYKKSYSSISKLGGGVLLDLSHEIDYVNYFLGTISKINGIYGRKSDITVDSDDFADLLVDSKNGMSNIHINFLSHVTLRKVYVDFQELSIIGDINKGILKVYKRGKIVNSFEYKTDRNTTYKKQFDYFFNHINDFNMMNNLHEAAELFNKIIDFKARQQI